MCRVTHAIKELQVMERTEKLPFMVLGSRIIMMVYKKGCRPIDLVTHMNLSQFDGD